MNLSNGRADLKARDIMRRDVITVPPEMDIWELGRFLSDRGITGAPVVDKTGAVVGVVSQTDIVRRLKDLASDRLAASGFYDEPEHDSGSSPRPVLRARDLMNFMVVQTDEETSVHDIGKVMLSRGVHRIIVTSGGRMVGIITTMDLLKVI